MKIQPELHKKTGIYYALTTDGLELPIVDVTHPAFAVSPTDAQQAALVAAFVAQEMPFAKLPPMIRRGLLRFFLRGSVLARGIRGAQGTFLGGMSTYLLKLGPDNLGDAYARPIDRRIAAALPALAVRWRLADMARLLADRLAPRLEARAGAPLRFVNIAGGAGDGQLECRSCCWRASAGLAVVACGSDRCARRRRRRADLRARALATLSAPGAPLHAVDARLHHVAYDWNDPRPLRGALDDARSAGAVTIGSSEGGLFEYGSDDAILANLTTAREAAPPDFAMLGSVTRADRPMQRLRETSQPATRPRGLEVFRALVARAGWSVTQAIERPFSDQVVIMPTG